MATFHIRKVGASRFDASPNWPSATSTDVRPQRKANVTPAWRSALSGDRPDRNAIAMQQAESRLTYKVWRRRG